MDYTRGEQRNRSSLDLKTESPRVHNHNRTSFDASKNHRYNGAADQLRASFDARDLSSLTSLGIKDVVRASFQKERSRSSVDGRDGGNGGNVVLRESPRALVTNGTRQRDAPRSSVDGRDHHHPHHQSQASIDSPRLSMRIKDAVRAAVEGRMDLVRASFDSKESLRTASNKSRENARSSTADSRLLVELRESPRLSRDAPRYSCDGRDGRRSTTTVDSNDQHQNNVNNITVSRESLRAAQKAREDLRYSVDGRLGPPPPADRLSVDDRESPRFHARELPIYAGNKYSSQYEQQVQQQQQQGSLRSDSDGKDQLSNGGGETRKRVPSLVARLMGLEELPDAQPLLHQVPAPTVAAAPSEQPTLVPQQTVMPQKKPFSKESKLLKSLLQYSPRTEETKTLEESRQGDDVLPQHTQDHPASLKHVYSLRQQQQQQQHRQQQQEHQQQQQQAENTTTQYHQGSVWNGNQDRNQESPRKLKLPPRQLGMETMPAAFKHQEAREIGALRQKVVQSMPKQLTEAVLTVLKNADEKKRMPMSYADMENRLRQLRLRSSLQEHKTLRQILEAMQTKGLLHGATNPKDVAMEHEPRHSYQEDVRSQPEVRYQNNPPKQSMLPKSQEITDSLNTPKLRNFQELKKLGARLQEQSFRDTVPEENVKSARAQHVKVPKPGKSVDEQAQQPVPGASIVVMKPIGRQVKKASKAQNPALLIESMPGPRSPQRGREAGGRSSPWGSPVNKLPRPTPGFGFGRESTGRCSPEEGAALKLRRERILARSALRDVQSEPSTPRSPKLIALPQSMGKQCLSSASKEAPESTRHLKVSTSAGSRSGDSGKKGVRSTSSRDVSSRAQSSRDLLGLKKQSGPEAEQLPKEQRIRRSSSDGKMSSQTGNKEVSKVVTPAEVTILRNKPSLGKRVSLLEADSRTNTTNTKRGGGNNGSKPTGTGERVKERIAAGQPPSQAPITPRSSARNAAELSKKNEEVAVVLDHVRVTDGDAFDQSNARSPLVGLTNRLQGPEVGLGELDREGQGVRTPRAGVLVKKMFAQQEDANLVVDVVEIPSEQLQPSPVSVLDGATFCEEDVSPLALNKIVDGMQDKLDAKVLIAQQADTALQECKEAAVFQILTPGEGHNCEQLIFLRESAKILPPKGQIKPLILKTQAEKVYVRDILVVSGATMGRQAVNPSCSMIESTVFDYLEEKQGNADYKVNTLTGSEEVEKSDGEMERQGSDRRMMFDCVNDVLETLLVPYATSEPWMGGILPQPLRRRPTGQALVQQLWDQLQSLPPHKPCEDICDSLYTVLQKDLLQPINSWTEFSSEIEDVGLEIEKMIFKELIEETLLVVTT